NCRHSPDRHSWAGRAAAASGRFGRRVNTQAASAQSRRTQPSFLNQLRSNLLRDIMLVEVLPSWRYRYRLIGTANAKAHRMNATGRYLDEVLPGPEYKAHVLGLYDGCVRARRPLYSECLFISLEQAPERHTKVLFLLLSDDGERVNQVLVVQVFFYIDPATRQRRFIEPRPFRKSRTSSLRCRAGSKWRAGRSRVL